MLRKTDIESAKHPGGSGDFYLWDRTIPGFGLRIYPSGKKVFVFGYRFAGKWRRVKIGQYPSITLEQAKETVLRYLSDLNRGLNPLLPKVEPSESISCSELVDTYIERHAKPHKKTWRKDKYLLDLHFVKRFGSRKIDSITKAEIRKHHFELSENSPIQANRLISCLSKAFQCAIDWGLLPEDHSNPARGIAKNKERKREVWIKPEKFSELMSALAEEPLQAQAAIKLFLITGLRHQELIRIRWSDIDFQQMRLNIPAIFTKNDKPHTVPLPPLAIEIFKSIYPKSEGKVLEINPYVFAGRYPNTHWQEFPRKSWRRIREKIGMPELTIHSLRHTVASWMASSGVSLKMIGQILNQSTPSITERYAHLADDPIREVLNLHAEKMFEKK